MSGNDVSGPAFPLPDSESVRKEIEDGTDGTMTWERGLSRREYFAAAALAGCEITVMDDHECTFFHSPHELARRCFAIADAMIKESE